VIGSLAVGVPPFIDLVGVRLISLIGTFTPAWVPGTYTLREAGNGVVVKVDPADFCPLPVAAPLPMVWSLMRRSFLSGCCQLSAVSSEHRFRKLMAERCALIAIFKQKSRTDKRGCGRETNSVWLFSLPYAGITQVRF
jgi:hypothetical protein